MPTTDIYSSTSSELHLEDHIGGGLPASHHRLLSGQSSSFRLVCSHGIESSITSELIGAEQTERIIPLLALNHP